MHNINSYWYQEYTSLFDFTMTCDGYNSFLPSWIQMLIHWKGKLLLRDYFYIFILGLY